MQPRTLGTMLHRRWIVALLVVATVVEVVAYLVGMRHARDIQLSLATLAAAWGGYQAARWGGVQSTRYGEASAARIESTRQSSTGYQLAQLDIATFTNFMNAYAQGNTDLADFYVKRFRPDFRPAYEAWMALDPLTNPDAPPSPFGMPEYQLPQAAEADRLSAEAATLFAEGKEANQTSDNYVLTTVVLAMVLFFGGISSQLDWLPVRGALVGFAALVLIFGLARLARFPIQ
jgi:hypothetical protein